MVVGLIAIVVVFQVQNSLYLSAGNIVNLLNQTVVFLLFAMGEVFVLLLGEIDLSVVFNAGIGAGLMAALIVRPYNLPWWLAVLAGLGTTTAIGLIQGVLITRLRLPAFIVTLCGWIGLQGVMIWMFDSFSVAVGGVISISNRVLVDLVDGNLSRLASWISMAAVVVAFAAYNLFRDTRRRAAGLVTTPMGVTLLKVGAVTVTGVLLVWVCNVNRGTTSTKVWGVPWSIPVVLVIFFLASLVLARTRFGRYVYAIGGNTEAARRAGINVRLVRTVAFGLAGLMAGLAGLMYLSQQGSIATDIDPTYVLYGVGAAVIGGTEPARGPGQAGARRAWSTRDRGCLQRHLLGRPRGGSFLHDHRCGAVRCGHSRLDRTPRRPEGSPVTRRCDCLPNWLGTGSLGAGLSPLPLLALRSGARLIIGRGCSSARKSATFAS